MKLDGKVALVTGGASGLGEATVRCFLEEGARVAILDRPDSKGEVLAQELGSSVRFAPADVTDEKSVSEAVASTAQAWGDLHVLVNCAGIGWAERIVNKENAPANLEAFSKVVGVNLIGTFNVIRLAAARMVGNEPDPTGERGVIVNTASVAAFDGQIGQAAYSASKGGVVGMTLPIARDLSSRGIRVVTIAPGTFETPMMAAGGKELMERLGAQIPFPRRLGQPAEFAHLAAAIVTNGYLNGEVIRLDGAIRMPPR